MKTRRWFLRMLGMAPVTAPVALEAAMAAPALALPAGGVTTGIANGWVWRSIVLTDADFVARSKIPTFQPIQFPPVDESVSAGGHTPIRIKVGLDADGKLAPRLAEPQPTHNTALACAATARQMKPKRT